MGKKTGTKVRPGLEEREGLMNKPQSLPGGVEGVGSLSARKEGDSAAATCMRVLVQKLRSQWGRALSSETSRPEFGFQNHSRKPGSGSHEPTS